MCWGCWVVLICMAVVRIYRGKLPRVMTNLMKRLNGHIEHFPKNSISRCWIVENDSSGDLLSQLQVHTDDWDEVGLAVHQVEEAKT
jgi:hypothetical protein